MSASFDHTMPKRMHRLYRKLTGLDLPWTMQMLWPWEMFCLRFNESDLAIVIEFIKNQKRQGKPARSLAFRSLISGPSSLEFFGEDLAEAKSRARQYQPTTSKDAVLKASGRPAPVQNTVRSAAEIVAGEKAFAQFKQFGNSL